MSDAPLLLRCCCCCSVLQMDDLREDDDPFDVNAHFALAVGWLGQPYTLRARLQHAWQALRGEGLYYHEMVLGLTDVHVLRRWLERYADEVDATEGAA